LTEHPGTWLTLGLKGGGPGNGVGVVVEAAEERVVVEDVRLAQSLYVRLQGGWRASRPQQVCESLGGLLGRMRIHIDTDFGGDPDDACALAFLLGSPGAQIVGIARLAS